MSKLKLHEAIAAVLLTKKNRTATTQEIADEINSINLYQKKDGSLLQTSQIKLRTTLSRGQYIRHFEFEKPDKITLRNQEF